nr:pancreatic triacylglycerol lipase-like [Onthophagus taurus]
MKRLTLSLIWLLNLTFLLQINTATTSNLTEDVTFRLFTVNNKYDWRNLGFDVKNLTSSGFDFNKDTKIITHGFLNNGSGFSCIALRDAFLKHYDINVIIIDYKNIANDIFSLPQSKINEVGGYVAKFLNFLFDSKYNGTKIHLLGHSLGGHVMGYAASHAKNGTVGRVSGLDPALTMLITDGLNSNVAEFVDVIHTCKGIFGAKQSLGTVDFWPNGGIGKNQPSCSGLGSIICSHYEAVRYMSRSINDTQRYPAHRCDSYTDFKYRKCENNDVQYMGIATNYSAKGNYYLCTQNESDYLN